MRMSWILGIILMVIPGPSHAEEKTLKNPQVVLETSKGNIVIELSTEKAPVTIQNFLSYVRSGFYNDTIFHRVIHHFMIQGGGYTLDMENKPTGQPITNEADNGLKNSRGTIAMARTMDPQSATAQFFINTVDNKFLDHRDKTVKGWGYAVFGKVIEGMDVVDAISQVKTGTKGPFQDVPVEPVVIHKAWIHK